MEKIRFVLVFLVLVGTRALFDGYIFIHLAILLAYLIYGWYAFHRPVKNDFVIITKSGNKVIEVKHHLGASWGAKKNNSKIPEFYIVTKDKECIPVADLNVIELPCGSNKIKKYPEYSLKEDKVSYELFKEKAISSHRGY